MNNARHLWYNLLLLGTGRSILNKLMAKSYNFVPFIILYLKSCSYYIFYMIKFKGIKEKGGDLFKVLKG